MFMIGEVRKQCRLTVGTSAPGLLLVRFTMKEQSVSVACLFVFKLTKYGTKVLPINNNMC